MQAAELVQIHQSPKIKTSFLTIARCLEMKKLVERGETIKIQKKMKVVQEVKLYKYKYKKKMKVVQEYRERGVKLYKYKIQKNKIVQYRERERR